MPEGLARGCAALVALYVFRALLNHAGRYLLSAGGEVVLLRLRCRAFARLQRLDLERFEAAGATALVSTLERDAEALRDALTWNSERILQGVIYCMGGLLLCVWVHARLTAVIFLAVLPIAAASLGQRRHAEAAGVALSTGAARRLAQAQGALQATKTVRLYGREAAEEEAYAALAKGQARLVRQTEARRAAFQACLSVSHSFALVAVLWFAGRATAKGELSPGELLAVVTWVTEIGKHLDEVARNVGAFTEALGRGRDLLELLAEEGQEDLASAAAAEQGGEKLVEPAKAIGSRSSGEAAPVLELRGATYYRDGGRVLSGVDLTVREGEIVVLVGASGAGKTTLLDLVPGFKECSAGSVEICGVPCTRQTARSLRRRIGWVPQEYGLLEGSLWHNLSYGVPPPPSDNGLAARGTVVRAARAAGVDGFADLGSGLDSLAAGPGAGLSGGQAARVLVARALARNPRLLLLDEPSAALDTQAESKLLQNLRRHVRSTGCGCLMVAHRLQAARLADRVVVLGAGGSVIQSGSHDELYARTGLYRTLYDLQAA